MLTTTYDAILAAVIPLAGQPIGKSPDAALVRVYAGLHLPRLHQREAWPGTAMDFVAVTVADGEFTKNETTQGDLLSLYAGGNPQTSTTVQRLDDWEEGDGVVRVTFRAFTASASAGHGTLYAEFQTPPPTLPAFGAAGLGATAIPAVYEFPLAALVAAELLAKEDPAEASRLRGLANTLLLEEAGRFKRPWWRK